ncbi:hypothetical protein NPIL_603291, partial [Nephila pilipes]
MIATERSTAQSTNVTSGNWVPRRGSFNRGNKAHAKCFMSGDYEGCSKTSHCHVTMSIVMQQDK